MADYATLLRDHTTLSCRSVDRFFLQGYVPKLQSVGQVCRFLGWQRRFPSRGSKTKTLIRWRQGRGLSNSRLIFQDLLARSRRI